MENSYQQKALNSSIMKKHKRRVFLERHPFPFSTPIITRANREGFFLPRQSK
jgi:hypothetical protein